MTNAMFERMKPLPFTAPMAIATRLVLLVCGVSGLAGAALADERSDGVTPRIVLAPQAPLARGAEIARAVVYLEAGEADVSLTPGPFLVSPILLRVQGPVFGWLGESEPYPDRHFPELRFFSNGQPVPYTESFRATVGTVDISALLSDAKVSPWLIADTPPFVATEDMPAETRSKLTQAGAMSASGGDYLAQWRAQRTLGVALVPGQTLDMRYRLRPGYALLSLQELGGATLRQRYCLTGSHLQALQTFINRKKSMGYHRLNYQNFIRLVRRLLELPPGDRTQSDALRRQILDRGQGKRIGFKVKSLMHRVGGQPFGDGRGPHQFRRQRRLYAFIGEAARGVFGGEQLAQTASRIA